MSVTTTSIPADETMEPLRRAVAGVLAGLAGSIAALIAVLLIAWGHCGGGTGEDCDTELAIAALAAIPALLLAAVVLLLLSSRASSRFLNNSLVALALFVALLPLAVLASDDWWSLFLFGALLSGLVAYIVVPYSGEAPRATPRQPTLGIAQRTLSPPPYDESLRELQFWADQVKTKADDLRRKVRALRWH